MPGAPDRASTTSTTRAPTTADTVTTTVNATLSRGAEGMGGSLSGRLFRLLIAA
ncbi:hypothetical protein GCM10025786_13920 [Nocardioides caeni]